MTRLSGCGALLFLLAGAHGAAEAAEELWLTIIDRQVDWGYETVAGSRTIDTLIVHSTYYASGDPYDLDGVLRQFRDTAGGVASHYLIGRAGDVFRLVEENDVAYHAGSGKMADGRTGINDFSIGIEINNTKTEGPTDSQYEALRRLVLYLQSKYGITSIVGHSDVTDRKTDPWKFDWERLRSMTARQVPVRIRRLR